MFPLNSNAYQPASGLLRELHAYEPALGLLRELNHQPNAQTGRVYGAKYHKAAAVMDAAVVNEPPIIAIDFQVSLMKSSVV